MDHETYARAADIESIWGETVPGGRRVSAGERAALMTACCKDPSPAGVRDAAIIAIAHTFFVRRVEFIKLDLSDFNEDTGALKVKGNKARLV